MTLMAEKEDALDQSGGDEDCPACKVAVAMGMYINVCKMLGDEKTCEQLYNKAIKEEISPDDLFKTIKEKAKDNKEQTDILEYIDTLVKDAKEKLEED